MYAVREGGIFTMIMSLLSARKRLCSVRNGGLKVGSSWVWDKHADRASKRKQKSTKKKQKSCNPVEGEGQPSSSISCHVCRSKLVSQLTLFEFWFCIIQEHEILNASIERWQSIDNWVSGDKWNDKSIGCFQSIFFLRYIKTIFLK